MSKLLIKCLFLIVWFVSLDCQNNQDRPKIITENGNIILEPALNKNIILRPNGPNSAVLAGDVNLMHTAIPKSGEQYQPSTNDNFDKYFVGPNSIISRLEKLESQNAGAAAVNGQFNLTYLTRRVNRLFYRVTALQRDINAITRDACESNPCQKGGTCLNLASGYHCLCPSNWEGKNCDIDVNECRNFAGTDLGCQNGASCYNLPGTYRCDCSPGWFGLHCTKREKDCSQGNYEMCGHGTCISTNSGKGFQCICDQGWENNGTGVCMTDIDECDSSRGSRCSVNPKVICINTPGSFRCGQCPTGYEGDGFTCSDIDECVTIPNGGCNSLVSCHNTIGSRICGPCPQGYQGDGVTCNWKGSCNINRGGCHPSAQCVENMSIVQCICPFGMDGDGVGIHGCFISTSGNSSLRCENNPCGIHGQCHHLMTGYTCLCFKGYSGAHCDVAIDPCAQNPCLNGGACRIEDTLTGYRCECTAQYTGNFCEMKAKTCGGYLDSEEGSIIYPLTNTSYVHDARCAWVIHTIPSKVINVTFSKFNLEKEPECLYDFLQIHDGKTSSSHLIGRFCGNVFPKNGNIISSHNYLYFWFRSDSSVSKPGFALHWNSIDPVCGGEVNASTHGQISSPGSPGKYPPNRDCYWHLATSPSKRISLHFFTLDIESHPNCSFDFIAIYDGSRLNDPLINKFCNSTQPQPILSSSSELMIHFHSDAYGSGYGFQISFAPAEGIPGCGGLYTLDRGEIVSPSYDGTYLNNLRCEYKISTSFDSKIRLEFKSFQLENSHRCAYDYLKIYDGSSTDSKLIVKLCGSTKIPSQPIISSSNNLLIIFKTDSSVTSGGFKIKFETLCQNTLFGDSGIIKSPGYPFSYPANKECEYIIGTVPGKAIQLSFQDFSIEDSTYYNCRYDFVEVRDGPDRNSTLLGKYCGGLRIPPVQVSTHNFLYIRFNSDLSNPAHVDFRGFLANYTTINTECGGIFRETTGIINHPSSESETYNRNQQCSWMLIAPEGMHIKLTWNRFELESTDSCNSDYLELFEIDGSNHNESLGKYCGSTSPPSLTSSTNRLLLKFKSDYNQQLAGFSVLYTFLDASKSCGGVYVKSHGFIYSPGWPKRYEPNRACTWTIKVPAGQQIALNISHFNLEQPYRNKCEMGDYLEIRNGISQTSSLIGKYCGTFRSKRIVSLTNALYLHFHSDFYITGDGFKIEWTSTETGCGGTLTSSSGSITSPNYPEKYNGNEECFYRIVTNQGSRIRINFADLDLENTISCRDDYVEIFDGRDENSKSLGKHCIMSTKLINIQTTTNVAFIKFRSDFYISGKGFLLNYDTICQNNITDLYGIIESPDYPGNYPTNLNCLWTINVPKGNKINITFTHFDIHYHVYRPWGRWRLNRSNCDDDFLQLKESNEIDFSKKYCGTTPPRMRSTNSNSLQIKFKSGPGFPKTGFRMEWVSFGCGGLIQKPYGTLGLNKNDATAGEMECQWIIEGPLGRKVTIHFDNIYMSESPNCTVDSIEIFNGNDVKSPLISKFCHQLDAGHTMQSTSNFMLVRYVKHSDLKNNHFTAQFTAYQVGCGGNIISSSGFIYSPNYPNNYDNDLNCLWTIAVPANHRIELNFMFFDLYDYGENEKCSDSIRIYESSRIYDTTRITSANNYTRLICPGSYVPTILTQSNYLALQFVTDHFGTAKGFKVNFTMTCGSVIDATFDGDITNKGYISHSNSSCLWLITAPRLDQKITLTITHMSIPKTNGNLTLRSCSATYLRVYSGNDKDAPLINEYCGSHTPTIVSRGHVILVELGTYENQIQGEFSAHYSSLDNTCGGTLTSENGEIASPNYPDPYPPNSDCEWILSTSSGNRVYIIFEALNLEFSEDCNQDYVEVRENNSGGRLLGVYCGSTIPTNTTAASKLFIKFRSDSTGSNQGFVLRYGFLHGNDITGLEYGEIASPLFPYTYNTPGIYSWRIAVPTDTISVTIVRLEIHTRGETCTNSLTIYDGYDDDAPILENLCGILRESEKTTKTSSNTVFIKLSLDEFNTGSLFLIRWSKTSGTELDSSEIATINCGSNTTQTVLPGSPITFDSPNYPEDYDDNLNCEWVFKTNPGRHLEVVFPTFKLEERDNCYADSVSVYSSQNIDLWKPIKENICIKDEASGLNTTATHMKIKFNTDSSITAKGFRGQVTSKCGGLISGSSGIVRPTWYDWQNNNMARVVQCDWTVKVRPGREINVRFVLFNITNEHDCLTSVVLRNGESSESPLLGSGKYCGYDHEVKNDLITSSNALFLSYKTNIRESTFKTFELWYEEKNIECGTTSTLSSDQSWEIISSPNYPTVPTPFSECIWKFTGPPGEILRIDFIGRFDLDNSNGDCSAEYVELRDGSSEISPLLGRFCKEKPSTIKTRNNLLHIKYSTQILEPRNGFQANISIDVCGGTIIASNGELSSPGYPHMTPLAYGTVCVWRLIGNAGHTFLLTAQDINLPDSESPCATKLTVEESIPENNTITILKTFCGDRFLDHSRASVETSTNNVTIKLHIGKSASYSQFSLVRGFRFTFNSSVPLCTGTITTPQGYLTTPGYPRDTATRYCHWRITAPDENRRITLELIDFDVERQRIGIYSVDDRGQSSNIQTIPSDDYSPTTKVFESSGNSLLIYVWLDATRGSYHRFKAKFDSDKPLLCGGSISGSSGNLISPYLDRPYICKWLYNTGSANLTNTVVLKLSLNSSANSFRCRRTDPKLNVVSFINDKKIKFNRDLCRNADTIYRVPSNSIKFIATKNKRDSLYFNLDWNIQPCGGLVIASENPINVLNIPTSYNETLDCAWVISAPIGNRVEITVEGSFQFECSDEFITINQNTDENSLVIGDYCKTKVQDTSLSAAFSTLFVQYHSKPKNNTNLKLMAKLIKNQCGGNLFLYETTFSSPNYPKSYFENQECEWEIKTDLGSRISLQFNGRFAVEGQNGSCTKDAVILYDWKNDAYVEIARLCGRDRPPTYNSTFNRMKVILRTNDQVNLEGFQATWTRICGGDYIATGEEQFLYSPDYPFNYRPSLNCNYKISGQERNVFVKFLDFDLEGPFPDCVNDNLTITGESSYDYHYSVYCGSELPPLLKYEKLTLEFKTDHYISRKGFKLSYWVMSCGGEIKAPIMLSSSPVEMYDTNLNCTWTIEAPHDKIVVLNFVYFDLESSYSCYNDYLAIYDGSKINDDKRLALMCGNYDNSSSISMKSRNNTMLLQFVTDSSLHGKGFKVAVSFSYSESVGCGGHMNLTSSRVLKSPLIGSKVVYENFLDCVWTVIAPVDHNIKIQFSSFHIAPCQDVNQTALGLSKCDCDYVKIRDGISPESMIINKYCGHTSPTVLVSSGNTMSIIFHTDGEVTSSGFEATLSVEESVCGQSTFTVSTNASIIKSPNYDNGLVPRGMHCVYHIIPDQEYENTYIHIKNLDIKPGTTDINQCDGDKLLISRMGNLQNNSIGKDYIMNGDSSLFFETSYLFEESETLSIPKSFVLCGTKKSLDFYLSGKVTITLQTSPDSDLTTYKGFEIEARRLNYCSRNYSEPYGRVRSNEYSYYSDTETKKDCYTLITAPENQTISAYFISINPTYYDENINMEIFDGNTTSAKTLRKVDSYVDGTLAAFSTGRYMLLVSHVLEYGFIGYDLTYVSTDKGPGCGGKLQQVMGKITSPFYPNIYRQKATCEWELETPAQTQLRLRFSTFDLTAVCDQVYLQLVNRKGEVISTYCTETPADYTSEDNYIKIVFVTTMNNGGTGWVAEFIGIKPRSV